MKKNSKRISKGFKWSAWMKGMAQSAFPTGYHVINVETGESWDVDKDGKKIKCQNASR